MSTPEELLKFTKKLISINSVTESKNGKGEYNENILAEYLIHYLKTKKLHPNTFVTDDGRLGIRVFLKGSTKKTIILLAHHDTVGIEDYGKEDALNPDALLKKHTDNSYLYGRGAGDMKAGIAVGIMLLEKLAKMSLKTNILFLCVPDEENNSKGILSALSYLSQLKNQEKIDFLGVINLDCMLPDPDPEIKTVIAGGAIGKLLPTFYIVGKAAHAGSPFEGISANAIGSEIVNILDSNPAYSDTSNETKEITPAPTCLKFSDMKDTYNTQLPLKAYCYFNFLTYDSSPSDVLKKMRRVSESALISSLKQNTSHYYKYQKQKKEISTSREWDKKIQVYPYEQIEKLAMKTYPMLKKKIEQFVKKLPALGIQEKNIKIVEFVSSLANLEGPYIVYFFSPPYYPSSSTQKTFFIETIQKEAQQFATENNITIKIKKTSEAISDMNYLQINPLSDDSKNNYVANNPIEKVTTTVNLSLIQDISMPLACIGPQTIHPHESAEKVEIAYTFIHLPKLLEKIIMRLQEKY